MRSLRRRLELAAGVSLLMLGCGYAQAAEIIVFYIGDIDSSSYLGVQQGLSEANAQGEFMGTQYRLVANSEPPRGDNGAIAIIALFYTENMNLGALALGLVPAAGLLLLNRAGVARSIPYFLLAAFLWICVLKSGVHATRVPSVLLSRADRDFAKTVRDTSARPSPS